MCQLWISLDSTTPWKWLQLYLSAFKVSSSSTILMRTSYRSARLQVADLTVARVLVSSPREPFSRLSLLPYFPLPHPHQSHNKAISPVYYLSPPNTCIHRIIHKHTLPAVLSSPLHPRLHKGHWTTSSWTLSPSRIYHPLYFGASTWQA